MLAICIGSLIGFACIFNKLRLAIAVIKTAAIFLKDEFLIIFLPPVTSVLVVILWIWWLLTAVFVYS
jgi:choline transporter-like protein 2/4/5